MLVNANTYLRHGIYGIPHLLYNREQQQNFLSTTQSIPHSPAGLDFHERIGLSLKYKKWPLQVILKMGSDGIFLANANDLALSSSYETAMEALSSLITCQKRGDKSKIGGSYGKLDRMHMYLKILGLEEHMAGLKIIHVAGTKGKGSTCAFCEAILRECGFRTGLFTSPHLIDVRERFRVNGLDTSEDKFLQYFWDCWHQLKENLSEELPMPPLFQFLTVLAFKIFICEEVDVAIIEVGLGGTRDSTNVIKEPVVCGITSLGMDHVEALGNTLGKIASHKAGILKPQIPAFTVSQLSEAMDVLQERASELMVPLEVVPALDPKELDGLKLGLCGDHQLLNAGLAVAICRCWLQSTGNSKKLFQNAKPGACLPEPFLRGLMTAHLSGRAQIVYDTSRKSYKLSDIKENSPGDLIFYLDGAHSPESMEVCARWFSNAIKEDESSSRFEIVEEFWGNGRVYHHEGSNKISKQIILFNCMEVRDPHILLPRLFNTCASSGVHFSKALFVPSMSTYNKVTSAASIITSDVSNKDLSWQFTLQRIWEILIHGKDSILDGKSKIDSTSSFPPDYGGFLYGDPFQKCNPANNNFSCSAVIPSLPLTIKWLRDCVRENPSLRVQVLVTGSLHLVGDVLKLLKR